MKSSGSNPICVVGALSFVYGFMMLLMTFWLILWKIFDKQIYSYKPWAILLHENNTSALTYVLLFTGIILVIIGVLFMMKKDVG